MLRPRVRLVVLNYNGGDMTLRCLDHLQALDWPADRLELVLVDNASTDGIAARMRAERPAVQVIETGANLGFPANNRGMRDLDGVDYVGLVNNDSFVEPAWLAALVEAMEVDPAVGGASAKVVFEPRFRSVPLRVAPFRPGGADPRELGVQLLGVRVGGTDRWADAQAVGGFHPLEAGPDGPFHWSSATGELRVPQTSDAGAPVELELRAPGREVDVELGDPGSATVVRVGPERTWVRIAPAGEPYDVINNVGSVVFVDGHGADRGFLERDTGQYDEPVDVFAWCGASVLLRADYLRQVGLLEERFFMYYEDTDLSWRGRAVGWRHRYVPAAVARHLHAATSVEGSPLFAHYVERNRLLMLVRNAPCALAWRQVLLHARATLSYARRDVLAPLLRRQRPSPLTVLRRVGSEIAFLRLLPWALRSRRGLRRCQSVSDAVLLAELTSR